MLNKKLKQIRKTSIEKIIGFCLLFVLSYGFVYSQNPANKSVKDLALPIAVINIWTKSKMPGVAATEPETELTAKPDNVQRITNISNPALSIYPSKVKNAAAVIVCPGGGYNYVTYNKEGTEVVEWLNSLGMTALILKYRTPKNREGAFQDLQRALSLTRANAKKWNINPKKLGVIGFSAGGHLAARASNTFEIRAYAPIDAIDKQNIRPDFVVLVYPAYLERDGKIAPELNLKAKIPPTLIVHNEDDKNFIAGSKIYHAALNEAQIKNTFLLYQSGGHGYGLRSEKDVGRWTKDAEKWLRENIIK